MLRGGEEGGGSDALKLTVSCWLGSGSLRSICFVAFLEIAADAAAPIICHLLLQKNA